MNHRLFIVFTAVLSLLAPAHAGAGNSERLRVLTTIPDLADFARTIGGDLVEVESIARGKENLHSISARPSHLVAMSKADVFIEVGLSLEVSFVPGMLETCRNPRIQPGAPGFVRVSSGWGEVLAPAVVSRRLGDVHPEGNPHMNLDPRAGEHMARAVLQGLSAVDPTHATDYEQRFSQWQTRWQAASQRWAIQEKAWANRKVVVYHQEYDYLARACGMHIIGTIESKPGIPPTPKHLSELIAHMREERCDAILTAVWSNNDSTARVAEAAGVPIVVLPNQCGGLPVTETWIEMMDLVHDRLEAALSGAVKSQ